MMVVPPQSVRAGAAITQIPRLWREVMFARPNLPTRRGFFSTPRSLVMDSR
ncbi:unnamed protein product [Discosporangium mesarthrocarpum]